MHKHVTLIAGPAGSGKTDRLLRRYRDVLRANRPGEALWLAPTWRAADEVRWRLLEGLGSGCLSPGVMTFDRFAEAVLEVSPTAARRMGRLMKRQLVRQLIEQQLAQDRLRHFGPIARTGGLVDQVCELIGELKRLEIWPEHFHDACQARGITPKDLELLEIYDRYQRCLRERQLYDAEGSFWSARDLLNRGQRRPFEQLRLVAVDGFTDFTRTQLEILDVLAERVEELSITLPLETEAGRADLFAKPRKTWAELRRRHPDLILEEIPRRHRRSWPAMAHLEKTLFANPRQVQPAESTVGLEILAAARPLGEIELIGSRIKGLLTQGDASAGGRPVRLGEIVVVFRSPEDDGSLVAEVFDRLGIPVSFERGQTLDRSPVLAALVTLLKLDVEDWPFRDLLKVLLSNYFRPDWTEWTEGTTPAEVERLIRRLQVPRGRRRLLGQLGDEPVGTVLERLAAALDEMPQQATPARWADAWQRLADRTGLARVMEQPCPQGTREARVADRDAWRRMLEALQQCEALAGWLGEHPPQWSRRQALAALLDILASERIGSSGDESGRVRVLSAASARALRVPYLFLAGLSEKAFPPPDRQDRLYGEAEYQRLIEEGLPLVARTERNREEMLLFYEAITRATRRLYLSYPALDASAQPLSPSPFLGEVEQACGVGRIRRTEPADLSPVPAEDEVLSADTFRIKAVSTALQGDVSLLAALLGQEPVPGVGESVLAGLQLTRQRQHRDGFGPAEGVLSGDAVADRLTAQFSAQRTFSATELEQYATCPYRFFLERILKLQGVEELELAVDYLQRGRLAHELLARFHRRVNESVGHPSSPAELASAECSRLLSEVLDEVFSEQSAGGVRAAMREVDRRLLDRWIADYYRQHEQYDALWQRCDAPPVPEFFEVSFGRESSADDPPSTARPLELSADGETIRMAGRIDRIDTGRVAGEPIFNVLDYKTGGAVRLGAAAVAAGTALQLPLYAMAVAELVLADSHALPWQAGYWYLREGGFKPKQALTMYESGPSGPVAAPEWEEMRQTLAGTVAALVRGIRQGRFPVYNADPRCTGTCPYHTVCRINQVRSLEKTWQAALCPE